MKPYHSCLKAVKRIKACYSRAGPDLAREGRDWYRQAHLQAQEWADDAQTTTARIAQVISALSPQVSWERNLQDAERLIFADERRAVKVSTYQRNRDKAIGILEGWDELFYTGYNFKTYNFFFCIWQPTHETAVTIDRHAWAIAFDEKVRITEKRYGIAASSYREAAWEIGLRPLELQATTWLQRINEK